MDNKFTLILLMFFFYAAFGVGLGLIARTSQLPFFWAALVVQGCIGAAATLILDPELLRERMNPPKGQDKDPLGAAILTVLFVGQFALAALDVGRLHYSSNVPPALQIVSLIFYAGGWVGLIWSMAANKFFSSAIRLQPDRRQIVVSEGPYKFIRHPGYSFAAIGFVSEAPALGSWISILPALLLVAYLAYRTVLEEKLLVKELPGYEEYSKVVKFRWFPGVW